MMPPSVLSLCELPCNVIHQPAVCLAGNALYGMSRVTRQWLLRRNVIWNDMRCCVAHDTPETEIACEWLALELSAHSLLPILECIKIDHFNDASIVAINALLLTIWKKRKSLTL